MCSPWPVRIITPESIFSTTSVSWKLQTSVTPVIEARLRLSMASVCALRAAPSAALVLVMAMPPSLERVCMGTLKKKA